MYKDSALLVPLLVALVAIGCALATTNRWRVFPPLARSLLAAPSQRFHFSPLLILLFLMALLSVARAASCYGDGQYCSNCKCCSGGRTCSSSSCSSFSCNDEGSSCRDCAAGTYCSCSGEISCPAGKWSSNRSSFCTDCAVGKYNDAPRQSACKDCPAGRYGFGTGFDACSLCPPGSSAAAGSVVCTPCPANSYNNLHGGTCTPCASGLVSAPGSPSCVKAFFPAYALTRVFPGAPTVTGYASGPLWPNASLSTDPSASITIFVNITANCAPGDSLGASALPSGFARAALSAAPGACPGPLSITGAGNYSQWVAALTAVTLSPGPLSAGQLPSTAPRRVRFSILGVDSSAVEVGVAPSLANAPPRWFNGARLGALLPPLRLPLAEGSPSDVWMVVSANCSWALLRAGSPFSALPAPARKPRSRARGPPLTLRAQCVAGKDPGERCGDAASM